MNTLLLIEFLEVSDHKSVQIWYHWPDMLPLEIIYLKTAWVQQAYTSRAPSWCRRAALFAIVPNWINKGIRELDDKQGILIEPPTWQDLENFQNVLPNETSQRWWKIQNSFPAQKNFQITFTDRSHLNTCSVNHVIHHHCHFSSHISNQIHDLHIVLQLALQVGHNLTWFLNKLFCAVLITISRL